MPNQKESTLWTAPIVVTLLVSILCLISTSFGSYYQHQQLELARQAAATSSQVDKPTGKPMTDIPLIGSYVSSGLAILGFGALVFITWQKLKALKNAPDESSLVIHRAIYGAGLGREIDITQSLQSVTRDAIVIPVDNNLVSVDPAFGIRKRLDVQYSYGDRVVYSVSRWESTPGDIVRLVLPEDSEAKKVERLAAQIGELTEKIAAFPKLADVSDAITLKPYPLDLVKLPKHTPAVQSSKEEYRNKVQFVIKNSYDQEVEIWNPLWESKEVIAQAPLLSRFKKQDTESDGGAWTDLCVVKLSPSGEIQGWIGLVQPSSGDGLEVRLNARTTGYLIFPLKVANQMRYAKLQI